MFRAREPLSALLLITACHPSPSTGPVEPIPSDGAPVWASNTDAPPEPAPAEPAPPPEPAPPEEPGPPEELPPPPEPAPPPKTDPATTASAKEQPLQTVMDNAVYAPDPDAKALSETKAARIDKKDGTAVIGFCVDTRGQTTDIRSKQKFPGDPMIDQILRDTIARWRFRPFIVDGKPIETCTERTFHLKFRS